MVQASHVKPWRNSDDKEKGDLGNGICLCPLHHEAFDKGLLSFGDDGRLILSSEIEEYLKKAPYVKTLFSQKPQKQDKSVKPDEKYLNYHREHIFLK